VKSWRTTPALVRACVVTAAVTFAALVLGRPDLLVLAAPFGLLAALGLAHAPREPLTATSWIGHRWLHEGQSTNLHVRLGASDDVEQATVALTPSAFIAADPPSGALSGSPDEHGRLTLDLSVSPRRWGVHEVGTIAVGATSHWGGYRWGPQALPETILTALPDGAAFASSETPNPVGLIGRNRSRRAGDGSEFWEIRLFHAGDRLRRINWRTTLRTGEAHVVGTNAHEDSSVLLLVDAVVDVGASGGVDGPVSSLDATVRAATALADHHIRVGDRVALRVLGRRTLVIGPGSGVRHQRRIQELLAHVQPGWPQLFGGTHLKFRAGAGTIVLVLSPMLTPEIPTAMVTLARRGLALVAVDTLPPEVLPEPAHDAHSAGALAWRMRLLDRQMQLTEVTRQGIPVVAWRGPGTLDEVLRRLGRRAQLPRTVVR
jgi:uncharacterized protein (DUF58 family)